MYLEGPDRVYLMGGVDSDALNSYYNDMWSLKLDSFCASSTTWRIRDSDTSPLIIEDGSWSLNAMENTRCAFVVRDERQNLTNRNTSVALILNL